MTRDDRKLVPDDGSGDGAIGRLIRHYPIISIYVSVVVTISLILHVMEWFV